MDAETGFLIDGKVYEVPTLDSLTTDEGLVLYEASGIVQEDFVPEADETEDEHDERSLRLTRHPGFWIALMRIAYQRGNPNLKPAQVALTIGKTNRLEAMASLVSEEPEPDELPLGLTSEPSDPSPSGSLESDNSTKDSNANGGSDLTNGSDALAAPPVPIGTMRSDTSSTLRPTSSAASGTAT